MSLKGQTERTTAASRTTELWQQGARGQLGSTLEALEAIAMKSLDSLARAAYYYQRYGLRKALKRTLELTKRSLTSFWMVLFYCDLPVERASDPASHLSLRIQRIEDEISIASSALATVLSVGHPRTAQHNLKRRFEHGAVLWLLWHNEHLTGFGWTLRGQTMEPHYMAFGANDIHLFDFYIFPAFRGKGLNPQFVQAILYHAEQEGAKRAYIEAARWNTSQLTSLKKTSFKELGSAALLSVKSTTCVLWKRQTR